MKIILLLIFLSVILFLPQVSSVAWATNKCSPVCYADLDAGVNGDGTSGSPWDTLSSIKSNVNSNDVVNIKGSETISSTYYWDGADTGVIFQVWSGNTGTLIIATTGANPGIFIQTKDLILDGLHLTTSGNRDDYAPILRIAYSNSVIKNCIFDTGWDGSAIWATGGGTYIIENNTFEVAGGVGHAIHVNSPNVIVRYNTTLGLIGQSDSVFIQEAGDNAEIYGNYFKSDADKSDIILRGGIDSDLTGVRVYNNYLVGTNLVSGMDINSVGGTGVYKIHDILIYNNIFANKKQGSKDHLYSMIFLYGTKSDDINNPIKIYNNTICLNGSDNSGEMFRAGLGLKGNVGYVTVKNNIFYVEDTDANNYTYAIYDVSTVLAETDDYNYFYSVEGNHTSLTNYSLGVNSVMGNNPLLTSPCSTLTLQGMSDLINNGAMLSEFSMGISSGATWPTPATVSRPQGLAWDIGAYEYVEAAPPLDIISPSAPTGLAIE